MTSFSAQVGDWVREVEGAAEAIFKQSAQEVVNDAQTPVGAGGRMPVDTGFLRASLMASTASVPPINPSARPAEGGVYNFADTDVTAIIAGAELGQSLHFGYTAAYAAHQEYGAQGRSARAFVRTAAQKWPQIVARVAADIKGRLGL